MAGSDFLVHIQAQLAGPATSELDALSRAVDGAKAKFTELESAANKAATKLQSQGSTVAKIQADLAKAQASGDTGKIESLSAKLSEAEGKMRELASASEEANAALEAQKAPLQDLTSQYAELKQSGDSAASGSEKFNKSADGLSKLPGPLREVGAKAKELQEGWKNLSEQLGAGNAAMVVGAAAVAALVVVIVAAAAAVGAFALKTANAARDMKLTLSAMFESEEAGATMADAFSEVGHSTGATNERLLELTKELKKANVAAEDIPTALEAIATQESALGDTSGSQALIESLKSGQKSVHDLSKEMDAKFGEIAGKKALGLDQQMAEFKRNVGELFSDLDIEGVLRGISRLVGLFDQTTASGKAIKSVIDTMFGSLGGGETAFIAIERVIIIVMTRALQAINFFRRLAATLGLIGKDGESSFGKLATAENIATMMLVGLAIAFGPILILIGTVTALVMGAIAAWNAWRSAGDAAGQALISGWNAVKAWWEALDLSTIGSDIIDGLVEGIKAAAGKVAAALTDAVKGGVDAAKNVLKISSPSRVMMQLGEYTGEGMAIGVDRSASEVETSMAGLVEPPAPVAASAGRSGGITIQAGAFTFNITGDSPQDIASEVEQVIIRIFERGATQLGAPVTT